MMTRTEQIPYESRKVGMPWHWVSFPEWLDNLERIPKGVNVVSYMPVPPLMVYVNGEITFEEGVCTGATSGQLLRNRRLADASFGVAAG